MTKRRWLLATAIAVLLVGLGIASLPATAQAQTGEQALGAPGTVWGGQHVRLEVTAEGATLEFDCAGGTIAKPLALDAKRKLNAKGTFTRERGGPVTRDGYPAVTATYFGSVEGDTLRLKITTGPQSESAGEYVLVRGNSGRVVKCR